MAKLSTALKKMAKLGEVRGDNGFFVVDHKGYHLTVTQNGRADNDQIATICTCSFSLAEERDSQSDYFPETYHDNFKQAIDHINRCAA